MDAVEAERAGLVARVVPAASTSVNASTDSTRQAPKTMASLLEEGRARGLAVDALLEDPAARRHDRHAETFEHADVTGCIDGLDDGVRALNINRDPCVSRNVDALELKQESADCHGALYSRCGFPDLPTAVGLQRPGRGRRELTRR